MITSTQVKSTEHFKTLDKVKQILIVKKTSMNTISLGVTMSKLRGFDYWVKNTSPRYDVKCIVNEIIG